MPVPAHSSNTVHTGHEVPAPHDQVVLLVQIQKQALGAVAHSMLAFPQDSTLQNHGVATMLALAGCNMRAVTPGMYDVNTPDKQGCTVLHK